MAAGLHREEAASPGFEDIKRQNQRIVLGMENKDAMDQMVPISDRLAEALLDWKFLVGPKGRVLRSLGRNKVPKESISTTGLYNIVRKRGKMIGKPNLQGVDLEFLFPVWPPVAGFQKLFCLMIG